MSNITKTNGGGMPALPSDFAAKLSAGIAESRSTTVVGNGGKGFLRLLRDGRWVYSGENIDVQDGSEWAVNPVSLMHGWACWVDSELRGEVMVSMVEPKPLKPGPIDGTPYKEQRSYELRCLTGEDEGTEVLFKTTSYGGMKMTQDFLSDIRDHLSSGFPCPIVRLESDSYNHKKYGLTYNPLMPIVDWCDMNGTRSGEVGGAFPGGPQQPQPEAVAPVAAKTRQRRAPVAPVAGPGTQAPADAAPATAAPAAAMGPAPVSTTQAHTGQRRRPAAR